MKLHYLKYFCVLAEELHFRRAAGRLAISQPPLSASIKSLEEELGVQLLLRNSKSVQLTTAGAAFLVEAQEILARVARVGDVARDADAGARGRLDIGVASSLLYREVPEILAKFRRETPAVDLFLHELSTAEQLDKVAGGRLHAAFVHGSTPPAQLESLALRSDSFVLCLPELHPLARNSAIDLRELSEEKFVMFAREDAPSNHDNVTAIFSRAGIHPRTVHQARMWTTVVTLVSLGDGVALVPKSLQRASICGVRFIAFEGPPAAAPAMLVWKPGSISPGLKNFLECAARTINPETAL